MSQGTGTSLPFVDLGRAHAPIAAELRAAFERILDSSGFILGQEVEQFEAEFASYCQSAHCIGVSSGTAALTIMLKAAGIGPGDEVILPAHTFIASAAGVLFAGANPVCVDVRAGSGLIDPSAASAAVGPATSAILAVHLYGQACEMGALRQLANRHGLLLLEDAAQAHGATFRGRRVGGVGDAGAFSFYPSKNLGAMGDAGAICTDDAALAEKARRLRDLGRSGSGRHELLGGNDRLDALQAAFLRVKLRHLDGWNAARRELAHGYRQRLGDSVVQLHEESQSPCTYHLFPVRDDRRDRLADELAAGGIHTGIHYSLAVPDQPALQPLRESGRLRSDDAPNARMWAAQELSLPIFPGLAEGELDAVALAVRAFASRRGRAAAA